MKKIVLLIATCLPVLAMAQYDLVRSQKRADVNLKGPVYQVVSNMHSVDDDSCWSIASSATYSFGGLKVASLDVTLDGTVTEQYYYAGTRMTACEIVGATTESYKFEYNDLGQLRKMVTYFPYDGEFDSVVSNIVCDPKGRPATLNSATDSYSYVYTRDGHLDATYHSAKDGANLSTAISYDSEGRIVRVLENTANGPVRATITSYNKEGNPTDVSTTTWDPASKVTYHYDYPSEPDEHGNWTIRLVTITTNGKAVHCIERRSLLYFK
ncbi:MAG: hypothetical protein IJ789_02115 [Bacteroidales bacterium]|nr:hypothetical protein [Bacteroidales bacterium]